MPGRDTLPIRVLGMGSDIGTDQIGFLAVSRLEATRFKQRYPDNLVDIAVCHSPAFLIAQYARSQALIVLDAYCSNDPPGLVRHLAVRDLESIHRPSSSHGFDLKQALELCTSLEPGNLPASVIGISIGPEPDMADENSTQELLEISFQALLIAIDEEVRKTVSSRSGSL